MKPLDDRQILVENLFASVDPGMRGWLNEAPNYKTVADGEVMNALAVGRVIASRSPRWPVGSTLYGWFGWQQYCIASDSDVYWEVDLDLAPAEVWLGALGLNGLTAWIGAVRLGEMMAGDTVLVTTASGGVGSVVGDLARAAGARAVGIVGDEQKIFDALGSGYSAAISYKSAAPLDDAVAGMVPEGIDLFFDNTGGTIADAVFPHLNVAARVIQCGTAAVTHWDPHPAGPRRERDLLSKRLRWQGFVIVDHADELPRARLALEGAWRAGTLRARHEILDGLDAAPGALEYQFSGRNRGRLLIRF